MIEPEFLRDLSEIIGDFDRVHTSVSQSRGHRSVSQDVRAERILDVSDLAAIPKGRAIVLASGSRPTIVRTVPWMDGPHATAIKSSIETHDPQGQRTVESAVTERKLVQSQTGTPSPYNDDSEVRW